MANRLLHTPEGVRDIYGDEKLKKSMIEEKLHGKLKSFGFDDIETPSFEYFDLFSKDIGTTPSREIYKFFDKDNNTMALRPDFTPGVARAAVKYFEDGLPIRLCYLGNTFSNRSEMQGRLKEVTELGAEFMGDDSVEADAEMIYITSELLKEAGITDFKICIGNSEFFKGLCEDAKLDEDDIERLTNYILDKNYFELEAIVDELNLSEEIKSSFNGMSEYIGGISVIDKALETLSVKRSINALNRLKSLYEKLVIYGIEDQVSFDLGMLSRHNYYTGIIFRAYTFGIGSAIVRGGRYDNLLGKLGKEGPAIGFTIVIDQVLEILSHENIDIKLDDSNVLIVYTKDKFKEAVESSHKFRKDNISAELMQRDPSVDEAVYNEHAEKNHRGKVVFIK